MISLLTDKKTLWDITTWVTCDNIMNINESVKYEENKRINHDMINTSEYHIQNGVGSH